MADFDPALAFCLREEGGFVQNPNDPGGATNRGITIATLEDWRGHPCTAQDVQNLGLTETRAIYAARYWSSVRGDALPAGVDLSVFDMAVNAGVSRSAKMLQAAVAVAEDGHIGPITLAAVQQRSPFLLIAALAEAQEHYYRSLATFPTFGRGWLARTARRRAEALRLLQAPQKPADAPAAPPAPAASPERRSVLSAFLSGIVAIFSRS